MNSRQLRTAIAGSWPDVAASAESLAVDPRAKALTKLLPSSSDFNRERSHPRLAGRPRPDHGCPDCARHRAGDAVPTGRFVFRRRPRRCRHRRRRRGRQCRLPDQRLHPGAQRRHRLAGLARGRAQGPDRRQSGFQPGARPVGAVRSRRADRRMVFGAALCRFTGGGPSHHRGRHDLHAVVHAGAGAAIHHAGDVGGAARHRRRQSDDADPVVDGGDQHCCWRRS